MRLMLQDNNTICARKNHLSMGCHLIRSTRLATTEGSRLYASRKHYCPDGLRWEIVCNSCGRYKWCGSLHTIPRRENDAVYTCRPSQHHPRAGIWNHSPGQNEFWSSGNFSLMRLNGLGNGFRVGSSRRRGWVWFKIIDQEFTAISWLYR